MELEISEVEITEFTYNFEDITNHEGHYIYSPGESINPHGFVLSIRTKSGLEGNYRGFIYTPPMVTQIEMVASEFLLGRDPLEREGIWQKLWHTLRHVDHLGLGPIDIALWDLAGKHYDEPVSTLLGGYKDTIPAYASTFLGDQEADGLSTPSRYATFAEECEDHGYTAYKIHPLGDPETDIDICMEVAERVGDNMDLMLDVASKYETFSDALQVGRTLDQCRYFWYEDPMMDTGQSITAAKKLVNELDTPVLGLEHLRGGPFVRANHITAEAADMVRADVHLDGGITGAIKIAHLVEAHGLDVELHRGGPATLQCLSAIRNSNYFEHGLLHPQIDWLGSQGYTHRIEEINEDGTISVPDDPGLGAEIDWEFIDENSTNHILIDG